MNRTDFMGQLDRLLQDIPSAEREEALQYYNDYFDDAGRENEQAVIKALGNPARVAENIKRDLTESGIRIQAKASDEAIVEYGKVYEEESRQEKETSENSGSVSEGAGGSQSREAHAAGGYAGETPSGRTYGGRAAEGETRPAGTYDFTRTTGGTAGAGSGNSGTGGTYSTGTTGGGAGNAGAAGGSGGFGGTGSYTADGSQETASRGGGEAGRRGRPLSGWAILLIVVGAIFLSPLGFGLLAALFGALMSWFALIFSVGMVALSLFIVLIAMVVVGIMCVFTDPLVGIGIIGGGLICGGLGLLFLMVTVALGGIVTPAIFRGLGRLFRLGRKAI